MLEVIRLDLAVYIAVNCKVHVSLLSHREHIKAGMYCTILSYLRAVCTLRFNIQ